MHIKWKKFKKYLDTGSVYYYLDEGEGEKYVIWVENSNIEIKTEIDHYPSGSESSDQTDWETNYKSGAKTIDNLATEHGYKKVAVYEPEGSFKTYVSHDFCDKSTWFRNATKQTGFTMTLQSGKTYLSNLSNWIDMNNGRLFDEGVINESGEYNINVYDDSVLVDPSEYTIDYENGKVVFGSYNPSGPITADFYYAGGSLFSLMPLEGKKLCINHAELQFSKDATMQPIYFEVYAGETLVERIIYKTIKDVISVANAGQGEIPAISGLSNPVVVFPFQYVRSLELKSSLGLRIDIKTENDNVMSGEWCTIAFYTAIYNE